MSEISLNTIRVFIHVLAVCIWVGGQFTLAATAKSLRAAGPEVAATAARGFAKIAWPAYGIAWMTGIWNLFAVHINERPTSYQVTVAVKLLVVLISGIVAFIHLQVGKGARIATDEVTRIRARRRSAILGMTSAITALGAVLLGVSLGH
ncbi:MAG: hypothetical protein WBD02_02785 [Acidimicrobiia bacterium]